jgi:hypothetical protein
MSGSSGSSQPVQTQTQTKDPWSGASPYLSDIYAKAQFLQNTGSGYLPYSGSVVADLDPQFAQTMQNLYGLTNWQASQFGTGVPGVQAATDLGTQLIGSQGITPGINMALGTMGIGLNTVSGALNNVYGGVNQLGTAAGTLGNAANYYQNAFNQNTGATNPYLLQAIADQNRLAANKVQSSMSAAGRYGSGAYSDAMARAQAEVADPILAQDWLARQQLGVNYLQGLTGVGQAQGQLGGLYGNLAQIQGGLGQAQAGIGQQQANVYNQGLNTAAQWAGLIPNLWNAAQNLQYQPYQMQMGLGQYAQDRAQQQLAGGINYYNAQQAADWQNLQRYAGILAGAGQLGGTQVSTSTQSIPLSQRLLGGTLAGAGVGSIFGPVGAGVGALGGGLLGLM